MCWPKGVNEAMCPSSARWTKSHPNCALHLFFVDACLRSHFSAAFIFLSVMKEMLSPR